MTEAELEQYVDYLVRNTVGYVTVQAIVAQSVDAIGYSISRREAEEVYDAIYGYGE